MKKLIISLILMSSHSLMHADINSEKQKLEDSLKNVTPESNAYYETLRNIQIYNLNNPHNQIPLPKNVQVIWR